MFHVPGIKESRSARDVGAATKYMGYFTLLSCLFFVFFWTVMYLYFDYFEAFNFAKDQVELLDKRQKEELKETKAKMKMEDELKEKRIQQEKEVAAGPQRRRKDKKGKETQVIDKSETASQTLDTLSVQSKVADSVLSEQPKQTKND